MNEELKIVIKAVTDSAKKSIKEVRSELDGIGKSAGGSSGKVGMAMKGIAKGAAIAIAAITAVTAAIVALGKKSLELIKEHSKLIASFQSVGASAKTAETTYKGLYRFLGDKSKATEAAAHLALIARNQEQLADWTKITQGVYARFGDSLPIEGLTEAANETLKVGKVTGTLADALNWAGVSEDEFNKKLAATTTYEEREVLLRTTLNGLYSEAAEIYEKNNKALLDYNESQAKLDNSLRNAGAVITPLLTALNNLSSALLDALKPALEVIIPLLTTVVNWLTQAVQATMSFFGALTGKNSSVKTVAKDLSTAVDSSQNLGDGMGKVEEEAEDAAEAIEKAKRAVMGFDELNIVANNESNKKDSASGSNGSKDPVYAPNTGGFAQEFETEVEQASGQGSKFLDSIKKVFSEIKELFAPTIDAWKDAIEQIKGAWQEAKPHFINGAKDIADAFMTLGEYLVTDFVPTVVNSFSEHIVPIIADLVSFWLVELGKMFEWVGGVIKNVTNDMIIPTLESFKMVATDVFEIIGNTWDEFGDSLMEKASEVLENLRGHFDNIYNKILKPAFDMIKQKFDELWTNKLKPKLQEISDSLAGIGEDLLILYNEIIAPVVNWIIDKIAPIVLKAWDMITDAFSTAWEIIADVLAGIIRTLEGLIGFITGVFTGDWEKAWEGITDFFGGILDTITGLFGGAWKLITEHWDNAVEFFNTVWEGIQEAFKDVKEWLPTIFERAWKGIQMAWEGAVQFFKDLWEKIKSAYSEVKEWFVDKFQKAWDGIKKVWEPVKEFFSSIWNHIVETFKSVGDWFKEKFQTAWNNIKTAFGEVKTFFSNKWNDIKTVFSGVGEWFRQKFQDAWNKIKQVFAPVESFFSQLWEKVKTKFSSLGTTVANAISGAVKSGINGVIRMIENTINSAIGLINGAIGLINKIPGVNVGTISRLSLPRLAKGGIATSATTALIGESGREAVLPLENNTEWMDKLADRIAARNNAPSKIVLQIGEKELGWATIKAINGITSQTGALQLAL